MTISPPENRAEVAIAGEPPRRRRRWWWTGAALPILAAAVILPLLAARYQPLEFGGAWGGALPGMPMAQGMRSVNTFGDSAGEIYIPPQTGPFTIAESILNTGPRAVTIEQVSLGQPTAHSGGRSWPLTPAGPTGWDYETQPPTGSGESVAGLLLRPGRDISVGITVRQSGSCYIRNGWTSVDTFFVKERFGPFTHWVAIPTGAPVLMHEPESPSTPGAVCPS